MLFKKNIVTKTLSNGLEANVALVLNDDHYCQACLYLDGRRIPGPAMPFPIDHPINGITHYMGDHPKVGLTETEVIMIIREVNAENSAIRQRKL